MKKNIKIIFGILFLLIIIYQMVKVEKRSGSTLQNQVSTNSPNALANVNNKTKPFLQGIKPEEIEPLLEKIIYEDKAKEHEKEHWVYFDEAGSTYITKQFIQGNRNINGIEDTLYTAKPFLNEAWIGGSLGYYDIGNGTDTYFFPKEVYGYEIVNIGNIFVNDKTQKEFLYKKIQEGWEIRLPQKIEEGDSLLFGLWVAVKQASIKLDPGETFKDLSRDDIQSLSETKIVSLYLERSSKTFEIEGQPPLPRNSKNEVIIFVDGEPMPITWQQKNGEKTRLQITAPVVIHKNKKIEIPLLAFIE